MNFSTLINALPGACAQGLIWGIMAIGVYITYRILDIADLTVDGTMATGGATCIMMLMSGHNIWVAMLAATGAGMLAGLVTGILHTAMGIPAILAGILTQLSLYSINLKIMGKSNQAVNVNNYDLLVSLRYIKGVAPWKNTIAIVIVITILLIAILYWFFGTEFGASLRATGCNPGMSRAQGINTNFNKVIGLMLSNGLVAFSSALLAQYQGFADVNMGRGAIVIGLAAVIIGEAIFGKIFRNFALSLLAVSFGAIIYYIVLQVVIWLGIDTDLLKLLSASVVAVFLAVPYWKGKYFTKPVHRAANASGESAGSGMNGRTAGSANGANAQKGGSRNA
ncbi:MAG: ABC transporter permease [Lachnospiraceae bacterium]|nr:ABC transporter permease [Lachnospiraceae bacterium]